MACNKKVLFASILLFFMQNPKTEMVLSRDYQIVEQQNEAYAKYRDGNIYIGKKSFLKNVDYQEGDVLVEDQRNNYDNPNMRVYFSYRIRDEECIDEIIDALQRYEEEFPSIWNRSSNSMKVEWYIHNILYDMNYQRKRTSHVDFNNADEKLYDGRSFQKKIILQKKH